MGDAGRVGVPKGGTAFSAGGKEEDDAPASRGVCRLRECFYLDWNRVLLEKRRDEGSANGRKRGDSSWFFQSLLLSTGDMVELGKERKSLREEQSVAIDVKQEGMVAYRDSMVTGEVGNIVYNRLVVNRGGEYRIVLADGSEVWVNSESELVYPVRFVGEKRVVRLKGEAYFKVQADADHPFIVEANGIDVVAVGTEFNVNSRKKKVVESVLVKGRVEVENEIRQVMLSPNQLAVCDVETNGIMVKEVDIRKYIDWKNGDFVFSDDRLEDVMNKLSLWYDCDVVYSDEGLKEIRLSGDMKRYSEVEEFLHFLEISTGACFNVKNKTIVVSIK